MKICVVSMKLGAFLEAREGVAFGGSEAQAAFLVRALAGAGHDVSVVAADCGDTSTIPFRVENAFDSDDGLPVLRFFSPRWTGTAQALQRADADIYLQRNAGMVTSIVGNFCRRNGRVLVYGAGSDRDFAANKAPVDGVRDRWLFNRGLKLANGIVVQNAAQQAAAARLGSPVRMIPNGVVLPDTAAGDPNGPIVWTGGLWRLKRPNVAIDIARQLPEARFVIMGGDVPSEAGYGDNIRRMAAGVANVEMKGRLSHSEVQEELRRASVMINTSDMEGFPNAYLEAWSHGVPVVTLNDVDGLIASHRAGVACQDAGEMVDALRSLMGDATTLREMGDNARTLVRQHFSPQALTSQYTSFFESLLRLS